MEKRELTQIQKDWILDTFFEPWTIRYPGARNIGEKLIENGVCFVAGNECIFEYYVGNFIKTESNDISDGCLKYTRDLDYFMDSAYFKEVKTAYCDNLYNDISDMKKRFTEISVL